MHPKLLTSKKGEPPGVSHSKDNVTAVAQTLCAAATARAFALWCCGGDRVVTWGKEVAGGDSSEVKNLLTNIRQIEGKDTVFAALLGDGSVVTWGTFHEEESGPWIEVPAQLTDVQSIHSTGDAFATLHRDGTVSTWGGSRFGADSRQVQSRLRDVETVS